MGAQLEQEMPESRLGLKSRLRVTGPSRQRFIVPAGRDFPELFGPPAYYDLLRLKELPPLERSDRVTICCSRMRLAILVFSFDWEG